MEAADEVRAWAASGAMALTGPTARPLGPPAGLVTELGTLAARIGESSARIGRPIDIDPLGIVVERAAISGSQRQGQISCGGGTRLLPVADGWVAVSLARPDDLGLLPAWLGISPADGQTWDRVAAALRPRPGRSVVDDGVLLGLPVALLDETVATGHGAVVHEFGAASPTTDLHDLRVVDLTSLWAGPLCGSLLADGGAEVVKVESSHRPDGARDGARPFFDLMNAGKRSVAIDFTTTEGRRALTALVRSADVVLEASRPRALEQLGIDAAGLLGSPDGPRVWVSITGHGLGAGSGDRIGFGDDTAVAGGLVVWDGDLPYFCADAVADPITGLVAAAAVLDLVAAGGRWRADVALARVAASLAAPTSAPPDGCVPAPPRAGRTRGAAALLGADTTGILATVGAGA